MFAGFEAGMGEKHLPDRVIFGGLAGGADYSRGANTDRMRRHGENLKTYGIKFDGWHEGAQKAGKWLSWAEDGVEALLWQWHDAERSTRRAAVLHATIATATRSVDIHARAGEVSSQRH